ncbi:MAG: pantoate--beta-alanine ligase, partial [Rhodothermia bacterium]
AVSAAMQREISASPLARIQYTEIVETTAIAPVELIEKGQELVAATAVYFGETRLIDNQFVEAP